MAFHGTFAFVNLFDISQLIQARLKKVQQQFPASRPVTFDEFRVTINALASITKTCEAVVERLERQDGTCDAATAYKEVERALDWTEFLARLQVNPIPPKRTLLFRAHENPGTDISKTYEPTAREVLFDDEYRQRCTVQQFIKSLARHLGKTDIGKPIKTKFTSTSSRLEWTLHLTGKKAREARSKGKHCNVGLVVFDLQALSEMEDVSVFRASDLLEVTNTGTHAGLIDSKYQQWAKNCDEYIVMGQDIEEGIVQMVPWGQIASLSIINSPFDTAYTLKTYCQFKEEGWSERPEFKVEEVCRMVVDSAKVLAWGGGSRWDIVEHFMNLILATGVYFWGLRVSGTEAEVVKGCQQLIGDEITMQLSQLSM